MVDLSESIAVVSHDAGGAEILSSYIVQEDLKCNYCLSGPALKIFQRKLGPVNVVSLEKAIQQSSWVLSGTSWQSELEWESFKIAKQHGKHSVAFIDHWVNYQERFTRKGEVCFPNEIWVGDIMAEALALRVLPGITIKLIENPYFKDLTRDLAALSEKDLTAKTGLKILFVSEPLRAHGERQFGNERHWGYTEEEALHYFLSNLHVLGQPIIEIVIRPHPSEPLHKYDWAKQKYNLPIVNGGRNTLLEEVAISDVVVGIQSMAIVVGILAGKRVISSIPPGGEKCVLPQQEVEHMQLLLSTLGDEIY